jgi:hypothetical protein
MFFSHFAYFKTKIRQFVGNGSKKNATICLDFFMERTTNAKTYPINDMPPKSIAP